MTYEEYFRMEEYFKIVQQCVGKKMEDGFDIEVIEYIKNVISKIGVDEIRQMAQYGVAEMRITVVDKEHNVTYDYVTLANDGENMAILQGIGRIEDEKTGKDKIKIGIILDKESQIKRFDIMLDVKKRLEKIKEYKEILDVAEKVESRKMNKGSLLLSIIDYFFGDDIPEILNSEELERIIMGFKRIAGEESYEIYKKRRAIDIRSMNSQERTVETLVEEIMEMLGNETHEGMRKRIEVKTNSNVTLNSDEEIYEKRRAKIKMTKWDPNNDER